MIEAGDMGEAQAMYNVIIVDDEVEIRNGLRLKIDWASLGFHVCGEAANGKEALDLLNGRFVHAIITDIRMPVMNGLELLRTCAVRHPAVKIVILSGYDDFAYLKTALQCGAKDYLLKPVVRGELIEVLKRIGGELAAERQHMAARSETERKLAETLPVLQEQLIYALISEQPYDKGVLAEQLRERRLDHLLADHNSIRIVTVEMRIPAGRLDAGDGRPELLDQAFLMMCRDIANQWSIHAALFHSRLHPRMAHFLVGSSAKENDRAWLSGWAADIQATLRAYLRVETAIGIGEPVGSPRELRECYLSSLQSWSRCRPGPHSQLVSDPRPDEDGIELSADTARKLELALRHADEESFAQTLKSWLGRHERASMNALALVAIRMTLWLDAAGRSLGANRLPAHDWLWLSAGMPRAFDSVHAVVGYLTELAQTIVATTKPEQPAGGLSVAEAMQRYIEEHYAEELSLTMLADRFQMNVTYLSELFKKYSGHTFSDYLLHIRLTHAVRLLADPDFRLADIAELTGFASASYFSSVFKKHFGISPNDYRAAGNENVASRNPNKSDSDRAFGMLP